MPPSPLARVREPFPAKWLACWTLEEIGSSESLTKQAIEVICQKFSELGNFDKPAQTLALYSEPDWKSPIYNVWKQQEKTTGVTMPV